MRITGEQIEAFDRSGYLHLKGWITQPLLARMRRAAAKAAARALAEPVPTDHLVLDTDAGRFIGYIAMLHRHAAPASLALAGSSELRAIGEAFCGPDFLATYEALALKQPGDGQHYAWHQDLVHDRTHRIVTVGVCLDRTSAGEGALRLLPGTHRTARRIADLPPQLDAAEAVVVEASPGDVVVHDVMLVHGSPAVRRQAQRRICYFEYRPLAAFLGKARFTPAWIEARQRLAELERAIASGASPRNRAAIVEAAYAGRAPHEGGNYS